MRRSNRLLSTWGAPLVLLGACSTSPVRAPEIAAADLEFVQKLRSEDDAVRQAAVAEAWTHGPSAIPFLGELLASSNPGVVRTAELSLWAIANRSARPDALGERARAAAACLDLLEREPLLPLPARVTLLRVLSGVADDEKSIGRISGWLDDPALGETACSALERIPHPAAEQALVGALEQGEPRQRHRLVLAVGARRSKVAVTRLLILAQDDDVGLARAARHALARSGDRRAEPVLVEAARNGDWRDRDNLAAFAENLTAADPPAARALYAGWLEREEAHLRVAALRGLSSLGDGSSLGELVARLDDEAPSVRAEAERALGQHPGDAVERRLESAFRAGEPATRVAVLRVLTERRSKKATSMVLAALKDTAPETRRTALELAADIDHPSIELILLEAAREGPAENRDVALLGYLRHAQMQRRRGEPEVALAMSGRVLELADSDAVLEVALRELQVIADPAVLPWLDRLVSRDALSDSVARVRFVIAGTLAKERPEEAIAQLNRIYDEASSRSLRRAALSRLAGLGVDTGHYNSRGGFLTEWSVLGPFPEATEEDLGKLAFPVAPISLEAELSTAQGVLHWRPHQTEDFDGLVDLCQLFETHEHVVAYATTLLEWPEEGAAVLKLGSDDGVAVWLNGELVHEKFAWRGLSLDEDQIPVRLRAGVNELVVKVNQGGGDWAFCVRLADSAGSPIDLRTP
ncbi:MAG: HEAT repeat domain-containing protein [Planctomycetota bacterium]